MAGKQQPGNNLWAGWDLGESGYKDQMDSNLRFLSAAVQLVLDQSTGALPASPTNGMLVATTGSADIQGRIAGEWVVVATAQKGWRAYDKALDARVEFDGAAWVVVMSGGGGGIEEAPIDGKTYGRKDESWVEVTSGGGGGIVEAPIDGKTYGRKDESWVEVTSGGGGGDFDIATLPAVINVGEDAELAITQAANGEEPAGMKKLSVDALKDLILGDVGSVLDAINGEVI